MPLAVVAVAMAFAAPPRIGQGTNRLLDWALVLVLVAIALQLVPLPPDARARIAPSSVAFENAVHVGDAGAADGPISVDRDATAGGHIAQSHRPHHLRSGIHGQSVEIQTCEAGRIGGTLIATVQREGDLVRRG